MPGIKVVASRPGWLTCQLG